jgi:glutamyl-tRNA synthetase
VESILADCEKLGAEIDKVTYTSNYFPQLLDLAERLIKAGHLYADDTPQEMMKEA